MCTRWGWQDISDVVPGGGGRISLTLSQVEGWQDISVIVYGIMNHVYQVGVALHL